MNFDLDFYKNKKVSVFFFGSVDNLPESLNSWYIIDFDLFIQNFDMWRNSDDNKVDAFFSNPIFGIKQHIANLSESNTCVIGEELSKKKNIFADIKLRYLSLGYDVIEIENNKVNYTPCVKDNNVRIIWQKK